MNVHTHSIYFLEVGHKIWRAKVTKRSLGHGALGSSSGTDSLACVAWRCRCLIIDSKGASASISDVCVMMCV